MREGTTLRSLLTVAREPSQSQYVKVSDSVLLRPEQIATLIDDGAINQASMLSSSQYARLQRLFTRLDGQRQVKVGSSKQQVNIQLLADSVAKLLLHIISSHQLNSNEDDIARLIDISMPLLFQAQALKPRQTFFFLLPKNIKIIKKLVCNASGRSAVGSIFHSQCFIADPPAIHAWAHSLTALAIGCGEDHDAKVLIDKFENLKLAIHDLSCLHDERQNIISDSFPDLSSDQDLIGCLQSWSLKLPISDTTLDSLLTDLRRHKMLDILKSNLPTFPCPRCHIDQPEDLKASMDGEWNNSHNEETDDRGEFVHFLAESDDIWKVSMSGTARKSMHDQGDSCSDYAQQLRKLAGGNLNFELAGTIEQQQKLKVKFAQTACGQDRYILWQIALHMDQSTGLPKQIIQVWLIDTAQAISRIVSQIGRTQQALPPEYVKRLQKEQRTAENGIA